MDIVKNGKDVQLHPCILGPMRTMCQFNMSIGSVGPILLYIMNPITKRFSVNFGILWILSIEQKWPNGHTKDIQVSIWSTHLQWSMDIQWTMCPLCLLVPLGSMCPFHNNHILTKQFLVIGSIVQYKMNPMDTMDKNKITFLIWWKFAGFQNSLFYWLLSIPPRPLPPAGHP